MTTKTDIAELTSEKLEEIRQRYRQTEVPKCHICGAEMTIQRMSASRITYGCAGAIYDETGCHYAEGRSLADDHYAESRITVVDVSDHDVLALVEALEKAQAAATQQGNIACALLDEVTQLRRHADEKAPELRALLIEADSELEVLRQRIAELESRTVTVKQYDEFQICHYGATEDYAKGYIDCQNNFFKWLTAAGIKWEAE
ncbi:TPA: ead/Ea22-like family protein [Klebsiella oxytoca]|nr:ead/Ea22-like family protein [Klebsiella oxytoca]